MGYSKIVNGFFASKGPAHGERNMSLRGIMFASSLDSRGMVQGGITNSLSLPPLPTHGNYNYFHDDRHGLTYQQGLKIVTRVRRGLP